MTKPIVIDFVSDVSCPWCVIGLKGLEEALDRVGELVEADIRFQPFELNPHMPFEGQRLVDYVAQKYGSTTQQFRERRSAIRDRAADLGFAIALSPDDGRVYNTFDAHRLLHWADWRATSASSNLRCSGPISLTAYNPGDHGVLADVAEEAGLDRNPQQTCCVRPLRRRSARGGALLAVKRYHGRAHNCH